MKQKQDLKACFDLTDWADCFWLFWSFQQTIWTSSQTNILYQFLWGYVHSYQDSFNLQQWQTMVHCKTQTASVKEDAYRKGHIVLYKQAKYTLEKETKEELLF